MIRGSIVLPFQFNLICLLRVTQSSILVNWKTSGRYINTYRIKRLTNTFTVHFSYLHFLSNLGMPADFRQKRQNSPKLRHIYADIYCSFVYNKWMLCRVALGTQIVLLKLMNNPLGVSPSEENREPREAKKKSFDLGGNRTHDLWIRSTVTLPTELQGRTEKVGDDFRW